MADDIAGFGPGASSSNNDDLWSQLLGAAQKQASPASWERGDMVLDTYRVESDPIHGGMGSVWRVRHTGWNVDLAMKRPQPRLLRDEKSREQFIHECRNWILLGLHPNIVSCYYVRDVEGVPTIFAEWMDSGSLKDRIDDKTLYDGSGADKQKRILDVAIQSARGLRYAHRSGLIHQDIKPANLMLTDGWQVKVGDFGLANPRGELTVLTGEATLDDPDLSVASGGYTPAYCSMEQMDGKRLTRRTDIYSWALTVLEMYLGSRLWQNGVVGGAAFRDYLEESDGVPLPDGMEDLLARCLEQDPENRPRDFSIIEEELKKIWRAAFGSDYPRPQPKAAADTAESLNNMALSWLDLGREDLAEDCWDRAVRKNSRCLDAVYNSALHAFRSGRMDDAAAVSAVRAFTISDPDDPKAWVALARVQSECGDEGLPATLDQVESRFPDEYSEDLASMRESADAQRMEEVYRYSGSEHDGPVEITPDGRFLLVHQPMEGGGHRGTECVRFLDAGSHEEICTMIRAEEAGPPAEVRVRASVNPIACFGTYRGDPNVYKWRTSDGKQVQAMVMRKLPREQIVDWDIDARGEWAIIASNHGRIVLMQTDTKETKYLEQIQGQYMVGIARGAGKCLVCLPGQDLIRVEGVRDDFRLEITADSPALALFVREDRDILVIRSGISPTLCLFDAAAGDMRWEVPFPWMEEWQGRQCQHSVSCDGNRVLLRTNSGWVLFSVPDHRWLCTIGEEQLHCSINLILRAYLTGSGDRVYFSDFMSRLTGYSVPEFSRRSPWVLSTIRTTLDSLEEQGKFDALRVQAEAAVNEGFVADALALVAEACAVSGGKFRTDPDLLAVIRRLSPRCRIEQPGQPFILKTWPVFSKEVYSISPSPDSRWIAALSGAGELAVLETETGRVVYRDPARRHAFRKKLQWRGSCFWSIVTGKAGDPDKKANLGGGGGQIGIRFMGQDLLSSSGGEVLCFDMDRLTPDPKENERVFADCPSPCPDDGVTDFLALPDGSCVYRLDSGAVCRYDRQSFPETILETESDVQISGAAVSPDGQYAIQTAGDILNFGQPDSCSGKSVIYRTDSGEVVFRDDSACISPVCAFTGDGRRAVIGQVVVDMNKMLDTIIPCDADCFPDFLDNRFLVTLGTDKLLNVFDMDTAVSVREASVDEKPLSVACSPDRNTLYVGSVKGTISVWFWNHTYVPVEEGLPDAEKGTDPETAGEGPDAGDLWASLLGAARTEAEKQPDQPPEKETSKPSAPAPDDPWAQLLSAAAAEINRQSGPKAAPPARDNPFAKGATLLDTYLVESEPMHGGMGSVWRVRHSGWNVDLAMKRPQPKMFADESSKQGFIDECRNWIDLGLHPNIVSCYYVREIDGVPAIFSEWMENGDLKHHIDDGTLYDGNEKEIQKRLLDIAIQYARGLRYAHEQGLIHQDVKPANLLLTNDWQAKAADFGLANARAQLTVLEGDVTQQDPGQSLNAAAGGYTPAYCSMEQLDGKTLTRRTDIYSWAVSVMEMYYGSRPWTNGVVAGAGCQEYLADPDGRVAVPEELRALLAECMEQDPEDRPHDFAVVEEKLLSIYRRVTGDDYPRPEPTAAPYTADSLNNRALSFLDLGMPEKAEALWRQALFTDPSHMESTFNSSLHGLRQGKLHPGEAQANVGFAHSATRNGLDYMIHLDLEIGPRAYEHARKVVETFGSDQQKKEVEDVIAGNTRYSCAYALSRIQELPEITRMEKKFRDRANSLKSMIRDGRPAATAVRMAELTDKDPDFQRCIYRPEWMDLNESLGRYGFPVRVQSQFQLLTVEGTIFEDDCSFDNETTRFLCGGRLYDLKTGALLADHRPKGVKAAYSKLSPDGSFLLRGRFDEKGLEKIDALTGEVLERYGSFREHVDYLAISPDGTTLAACDLSGEIRIWTNGKEVFRYQCQQDPVRRMWISPDNREIVFINWSYGRVSTARIDGLRPRVEELDIRFRNMLDIAVNTDFTMLVACGGPEGYIVYDLKNRKVILRENQLNVRERVRNVYSACILPNDRFFGYVSTNEIWFYATELRTFFGLTALPDEISGVAISRNWKYLALSGGSGKTWLYRICYLWYVPPAGEEAENERTNFALVEQKKFSDADHSRYEKNLKQYEEVYRNPAILSAYAQILHGAHPDASPRELLPLLMKELAERGRAVIPEEEALAALRKVCQ